MQLALVRLWSAAGHTLAVVGALPMPVAPVSRAVDCGKSDTVSPCIPCAFAGSACVCGHLATVNGRKHTREDAGGWLVAAVLPVPAPVAVPAVLACIQACQ